MPSLSASMAYPYQPARLVTGCLLELYGCRYTKVADRPLSAADSIGQRNTLFKSLSTIIRVPVHLMMPWWPTAAQQGHFQITLQRKWLSGIFRGCLRLMSPIVRLMHCQIGRHLKIFRPAAGPSIGASMKESIYTQGRPPAPMKSCTRGHF